MNKVTIFFKNFGTAWQSRFFAPNERTRTELRHQYTMVEGRRMKVLDYIDLVQSKLVKVTHNGQPVDHRKKMREIYYKYDLKGLKLYINRLVKRNKREVKKLSKRIKIS